MLNKCAKIWVLSMLAIGSVAHAALPGVYIGGIVGESYTNYSPSDKNLTRGTVVDSGVGGDIFIGYQFHPNLGVELDFVFYNETRFNGINGTANNGHLNENSINLMLKGNYALGEDSNFNIFAKIGAAFFSARPDSSLQTYSNTKNVTAILPAYAAGISYNFTPHIPFDVSWTHTQSGNGIQDTDLYGLGLSYYFG